MFKLQAGNFLNIPDPMTVLYQCIVVAALKEIRSQALKDAEILFAHQSAGKTAYNNQSCDGKVDETIKDAAIIFNRVKDVVIKFHTFDEKGMCNRLKPLVDCITTKNQLDTSDTLIQKILLDSEKYRQDVFSKNYRIIDQEINKYEKMSESEFTNRIKASYSGCSDNIEFDILPDGTMQCKCNYCNHFFDILKKMQNIDCTTLNPLQRILATSFDLL